MTTLRITWLCQIGLCAILLAGALPATTAHAQFRRQGRFEGAGRFREDPYYRRGGRWFYDERFGHFHYYPRAGFWFHGLPPHHVVVFYGGARFFFWEGVWYQPYGEGYVVVTAPPGCVVPALPTAYTTVWIGSTSYFYANGTYYAPANPGPGYVVVVPPPGADRATLEPPPGQQPAAATPPAAVPPATPAPADLTVAPKNGQSQAQMFTDRAECSRYATDQTGVDPGKASTTDAHAQDALRSYHHEERTCLSDRGYTVQ